MEKVRVIEINGYALLYRGAESFLMNVYNNIDHNKIDMDFLTPLDCRNQQMREEIECKGGKIYELKVPDRSFFNKIFVPRMIKFLKENHYDIVHIHSGSAVYLGLASFAAKLAGCNIIIAHAHSSADVTTCNIKSNWKNIIFGSLATHMANNYWACSDKAAEYMFGKKQYNIEIIKNGIDLEKFKYSEKNRREIRNKLLISDNEVLIGTVGQLTAVKNHINLIHTFKSVHEKRPNVKLIIIGDGPLKEDMHKYIIELHLENSVILYGSSNEVYKLMSAMDVFVLPSLFEGFPVVGVEAQCSGLPLIVSNSITRQLDITGNVDFLPIDEMESKWSKVIINRIDSLNRDLSAPQKLKEYGFESRDVAKNIENKYMKMAGVVFE